MARSSRQAPAILTLLFRQTSRPDELAMALSYANIWLLLGRPLTPSTAFLSGACAGLTLCTATGVFIGFLPVLGAFWFLQATRAALLRCLLMGAAGASVVIAACLVPLYLIDPSFYRQFFGHAGVIVGASPIVRIREAFGLAWRVAPSRILLMIATLPFAFFGAMQVLRTRLSLEIIAFYVAPLVGFALLIFLRSAFTYWWFLTPWFIMVASLYCARLWRNHRTTSLLAATWLFCFVALALASPLKDYLARSSLPREQQLVYSEEHLRQLIPRDATVLTTSAWWTLAGDHTVFDPIFSEIDEVTRIDFFVANGNGVGEPGRWREPANVRYKQWLRDEFEIVSNDLPRQRLQIFGRAISNSAYGFGTVVMRRKNVSPGSR